MPMMNFYIYRHIRPDTNEVFYIGKGNNIASSNYKRKDWKFKRNKIWSDIVKKNNGEFTSQVIYECETEQDCNKKEVEFIFLYGRKNMRTGTLANLTDGGEGCVGMKHSKETLSKLSESAKKRTTPNPFKGKKHTAETIALFSKIAKETPRKQKTKFINTSTSEIYDGLTETAKSIGLNKTTLLKNLRNSYANNHTPIMYYSDYVNGVKATLNKGRNKVQKLCNKVIDKETNKIYQSVKDASIDKGLDVSTLRRRLNGIFKNNTTLEYYGKSL